MRFLIGTAELKVPGGKLVKVQVDYNQKINGVKITGDFFLHPEEAITKIESCLVGLYRDSRQEAIEKEVRNVVVSNGLSLIGITEDAIARVVKEAMK